MEQIIVAVISLIGTALGTFGGIFASAKLTAYRIGVLERKVDKLGGFAERIPVVEERVNSLDRRIGLVEEHKFGKV